MKKLFITVIFLLVVISISASTLVNSYAADDLPRVFNITQVKLQGVDTSEQLLNQRFFVE